MTDPSPDLYAQMRAHALIIEWPDSRRFTDAVLLDVAAQIAQDALDQQAARYADLIVVARDALAEARELDGMISRWPVTRAIDAALAVLDEEP